MKKWIAPALVIAALTIGCSKGSSDANGSGGNNNNNNNNGGTTCNGTKTFSRDVYPIIQNVCSAAGCHNPGSINGPGPLTSYQQVYNARTSIRSAVASGLMPQNSTLSADQKNAILCWIDSGAPNN